MSTVVLSQAIDPASDRAVYKQIADHLRAAIGKGRLREGDQLPSEAQLMSHYGVARMTARNALRILGAAGLSIPANTPACDICTSTGWMSAAAPGVVQVCG